PQGGSTLQESELMAVARGVLHPSAHPYRRPPPTTIPPRPRRFGEGGGWPYGHLAFQRVTGAEGDA
ncbi:MAG: hypothetical protein LJE95_14325, partial [Acidobacteria bacterium]|nr:hypothetical protein [Acidobacteriota bacterium]